MNKGKKFLLWSTIVTFLLATVSLSSVSVHGLSAKYEQIFSQNDILFYDPDDCEGGSSSGNTTCFSGTEITWNDIDECGHWMYYCVAKKLISTYGEFAMALQEEYGYPWEVMFGQMLAESQLGVSGNSEQRDQQIKELSGGTEFNLMGITVEDNDTIMNWADNKYDLTPGQHQWPGFKNFSTMMVAYLVEFPRRQESTSRKLEVLKPDNYELEKYVKSYLGGYSQSDTQADHVLGFIDTDWNGEEYSSYGVIGYVRKELGLPSSAELAKEKNIQPGGRWPIDQYTGYQEVSKLSFEKYGTNGLECRGGDSNNSSSDSSDSGVGASSAIVKKAKELSWGEGKRPSDIMFANDAYTNAAKKWGGEFITKSDCDLSSLTGDHPGLEVCPSCARFVSMVLLESEIDPEFTEESQGGKAHLLSNTSGGLTYYLLNSPSWTEVEDYDGRGYEKLQPGDILIADGEYRPSHIVVDAPYSDHTFIYLGDGKVAEASNKHAGGFQYSWNDGVGGPNDGYVAFRHVNDCTDSDITWENGWITGGIDGYVKDQLSSPSDDAWQTSFTTNSPASGAVGPNKITLHTLEGAFSDPASPSAGDAYRENGVIGYPPHFTIDIKRKRIWQHFSIASPSCAIAVHDRNAGVQIEIMGYSSASAASGKGQPDWLLSDSSNFSTDDWTYLGDLLRGISAETGVPLSVSVDTSNPSRLSSSDFQSYEGILGHVHAPDNDHGDPAPGIWPYIKGAIESSTTCFNNRSKSCGVENKSWTGDFPVWSQGDPQWNYTFNACGTMAECGCGVVSFAMMATVLSGVMHDPVEVGKVVDKYGLMTGEGSDWDLPATIADEFNLVTESITVDEATASRYLRDGWMIWTCGISIPGLFSDNGHCIGLRGITSDGKWLLADSGNTANMDTSFDPSIVLTGIYQNGGPMVALKKKGT